MTQIYIIINEDLHMSKGKIAAQSAHAILEMYRNSNSKDKILWENNGEKIIVLRAPLSTILSIYRTSPIQSWIIKDAGLTQVQEGSITSLVIGPTRTILSELKLL